MTPPEENTDAPLKALVLRTTGTNCESETAQALRLAGAETDVSHFNLLAKDPELLRPYRIVVFAGGFSHGDDIAAGRVWGNDARNFLGEALREHVADGGLAIGVCNGFQVLVESGIFQPDLSPGDRGIALYQNASNHYECRWVELQNQDSACSWLIPGATMPCPVAHAEGRFVVRDEETLANLRDAGQIAMTYSTPGGGPVSYPGNPNGSVADIAGICDPTGRVLGLMPHPERNVTPWNHPQWTRLPERSEGEGLSFYRRMVDAARQVSV